MCTYGDSSALGGDHSAVLGGPGDSPTRRYDCSADVLAHPNLGVG
ncbi:hypothetical protein [Streptomyces sp. MST-110588]|nr:hypothetical protein [Streptomyces sp. MST-110588]